MAPSNKELSEGEFNQRFNMVTQAIGLLPLETRKEVLGYDSFQIQIQEEKKSLGAASREVLRTLDRFSRMMVLEHEIVSTRLTGVVIKTSGDFTTANLETTLNSQQ